jgi:hypothetical protein
MATAFLGQKYDFYQSDAFIGGCHKIQAILVLGVFPVLTWLLLQKDFWDIFR